MTILGHDFTCDLAWGEWSAGDDDDSWYEFNDSSVSKGRFEDKNCHAPYFLIFRRID